MRRAERDYIDQQLADPNVQAKIVNNPTKEIPLLINEAARKNPLEWDVWVYRLVVIILGGVVFYFGTLYSNLLSTPNAEVPDSFIALSSAALGALTGLLAPSPVRRAD